MKRTADIDQILRPLKDTPFQAYLSNAVQVADILEWILSQVGTAGQTADISRRLLRLTAALSQFDSLIQYGGEYDVAKNEYYETQDNT